MNERIPKSVQSGLELRRESNALRSLTPFVGGVDLCSNDYLGLSRLLAKAHIDREDDSKLLGATGSRLVSGTTQTHEDLEDFLSQFHGTEAALLFGSGYEANLGLLGSLGARHDTIIYDEYAHASMRDGIRLSNARSYSFRHNDLDDLRKKISQGRGDVFVAVESVYSMDGDSAPLRELCDLCDELGAFLIVDEAHATGVFGEHGEGLVQSEGLHPRVFARVHTCGKALGYRGAIVAGSERLREYLINFARPFIYSTAPDLLTLRYIDLAYRLMANAKVERAALFSLIGAFQHLTTEWEGIDFLPSRSHIQGVIVPSNAAVLAAERSLQDAGIFAKAIRSPTVPEGSERIRISLHSFNTVDEITQAVSLLAGTATQRAVHG
jgi:8-amino-7-oxononanoate synthase